MFPKGWIAMNYSLERKPAGLSASALRIWGLLFVAIGVVSSGILQNRILGASGNDLKVLVEMLQDPKLMTVTTIAVVMRALYTCAVPIFAFLLVEGIRHTSSAKNYLLRLVGLALVSEIPYNLAMNGKWIELGSRNPVFAMAISLLMLIFYRMYPGKTAKNLGIKAAVTIAAVLWTSMLGIDEGIPMVLLTAVLWALHGKGMIRLLGGITMAFVCMLYSYYYVVSLFAFLPIHFYNEEEGSEGKWGKYLAYPVFLLAIGLAAKYFI